MAVKSIPQTSAQFFFICNIEDIQTPFPRNAPHRSHVISAEDFRLVLGRRSLVFPFGDENEQILRAFVGLLVHSGSQPLVRVLWPSSGPVY